jgi:hypothetical protein
VGADERVNGSLGVCATAGQVYGVAIGSPQNLTATVPLVNQVVLNHTVTNIGGLADSYTLTVSVTASGGPAWTAMVDPTTTAVLNPVETAPVLVTVPIPTGVVTGTVATVTVTATSTNDPTKVATVVSTIRVAVLNLPLLPPASIYMSLDQANFALNNLTGVTDEDIVGLNQATGTYVMVFDGSDVGLGGASDIDAFDIIMANDQLVDSILLSLRTPTTLPGVGAVDDSDIIRFVPTSLGATTAGTFQMYFQGAQVGLTTNNEDIDALTLLEGDVLVISTVGTAQVPANTNVPGSGIVTAQDEDLLRFQMENQENPSGGGGVWSLFFDGSDVGLTTNDEDIDALYINPDVTTIYLSTIGNFNVPGLTGTDEDIFVCNAPTTGPNTTCNTGFSSILIGAAFSIGNASGQDIDAIDLP